MRYHMGREAKSVEQVTAQIFAQYPLDPRDLTLIYANILFVRASQDDVYLDLGQAQLQDLSGTGKDAKIPAYVQSRVIVPRGVADRLVKLLTEALSKPGPDVQRAQQ